MKALHANPDNIKVVFSDSYEIPEYQRPYTWNEEKCQELWDDIIEFHDNLDHDDPDDNYFLGCIALYRNPENSKWLVTDGQQRLITLSLLIKALYERSIENNRLLHCLFEEDLLSNEINREQPRIISNVLANDDNDNFQNIIMRNAHQNATKMSKNYAKLNALIIEWHNQVPTDPERIKRLLTTLLTRIEILRITSDSQDDALTIFETINHRGTPLDATDIFKVKLYGHYAETERENFISQWHGLYKEDDSKNVWNLFMMYMYVLNANAGVRDTSTPKLQKYFNNNPVFRCPDTVMDDIYKIQDIKYGEWDMSPKIMQWWEILKTYPNGWWQYPIYVFLHNRMEKENGEWNVTDIADEFYALIKETTRYLVIKGINYRNLNTIKSTILGVCAAIGNKELNYLDGYNNNLTERNDVEKFSENFNRDTLNYNDFGKYQRILIYLNSCLFESEKNPENIGVFYHKIRGKIEIEHILPQNWIHYEGCGWTSKNHSEELNTPGNLMLLTKKTNSQASNGFFGRKQGYYKDSDFLEAQALSDADNWTSKTLHDRDKQVRARIIKFITPE